MTGGWEADNVFGRGLCEKWRKALLPFSEYLPRILGTGLISIKLCNITKRYGERKVFEGVDAQLSEGASLVVTGRNGSGKSTLLRVIAGLARPTSGKVVVEVDGTELNAADRRDVMGLVAPDLSLYDELTALENLAFFAKARGINRSPKQNRELLTRLGLGGREDEPLSSYSSGMRQRAKYAFALLHEPAILLLDEPTANLDAEGAEIVDGIIREQKKAGLLILATNEKKETEYGDQVLELGL
jgi:heme exporter protein A